MLWIASRCFAESTARSTPPRQNATPAVWLPPATALPSAWAGTSPINGMLFLGNRIKKHGGISSMQRFNVWLPQGTGWWCLRISAKGPYIKVKYDSSANSVDLYFCCSSLRRRSKMGSLDRWNVVGAIQLLADFPLGNCWTAPAVQVSPMDVPNGTFLRLIISIF